MRAVALLCTLLSVVALPAISYGEPADITEIERISKSGETLGPEITERFPLREQTVKNDTGINVLIDLSHQANFFTMWRLPGMLRSAGFRATGSQASLDSVLAPNGFSRVRIPVGRRRPFAWWPNARYNVVITFQADPRAQEYLPGEVAALSEYVKTGGGLVLLGGSASRRQRNDQWPLNKLAGEFGAGLTAETDTVDGVSLPVIDISGAWRSHLNGAEGRPVIARRRFGRGRVLIIGSVRYLEAKRDRTPAALAQRNRIISSLAEMIGWVAAGTPPVGGSTRLPREAAGGGPIYPELSERIGNVIVYYAKNQKKELLDCITDDMPLVKSKIEGWLPSAAPDEPMHLILSAGGGGGWAVNAYLPKEVGIISLSKSGVLSVFAHELAHTMGGPPNDRGELAGDWRYGNQSEAHAGWFQGKAASLPTGKRVSHQPSRLFDFDKNGDALDLAASSDVNREKWGKGKDWTKIWWVWQKLDDRYGPTWYPRWRWVQHTRWRDEPRRRLSLDETVEDMSIAVGEDLFRFFREIGTTLNKERFAQAMFDGQTIDLPIAPLEIGPAGPVRLEPIGNYKKPIAVESE
ncbi:MAG: hypothetical protein ACYS0H_04010 [Planctomycetota bacterium]|jgi:hypothetical protein